MKTRESGMPDQQTWERFFDPDATLAALALTADDQEFVDFGCGYGTFALAAARLGPGTVHALDIDPDMVARTQQRAADEGLENVHAACRDFIERGTGLPDASAGAVLMFNNLHAREWRAMLAEAHRVLRPGGRLAVIHWNYDPATPRGPSMTIRLTPDACLRRVLAAGFDMKPGRIADIPPWHYGFTARRLRDAAT